MCPLLMRGKFKWKMWLLIVIKDGVVILMLLMFEIILKEDGEEGLIYHL